MHFPRFCILSLLLFSACTQPLEIEKQDTAIVGGETTTNYPAVAQISATITSGESFACSSTLISPRVLLTAAHCIDLDEGTVESITAYFGSTVRGSDAAFIERIPASDWIFFSPWNLSGNDIALVLLEHDSVVEPMPYNAQTLGPGSIGDPIHVVGWGNTSDSGGSGTKRHMTTNVSGMQSGYVLNYGNSNKNTCQGDSGGPGFMTLGGVEKVASVTSWGTNGCLGESGATRVARYTSWINNWVSSKDIPLPPDLSIVSPVDGAEVPAGFSVHVEASDNTLLETVEIWINGELEATMLGRQPPFVVSAPALPDGLVTIEAKAFDNRGDVSTQKITVTVDSTCDNDDECLGLQVCNDKGVCEALNRGLGDVCVGNGECESDLCATVEGDSLCTAECSPSDASTCSSGFECLAAGEDFGYCWPDSGSSGGCSTGGQGTGLGGMLLLLAIVGLRRARLRNGAFEE